MANAVYQANFGSGWEDCYPIGYKSGIELELIFTNSEPSATMQGMRLKFANTLTNPTVTKIIKYINGGVNGSTPGIFEGIPFQIFIPGSPNQYLFQGVIDTTKIEQECDIIDCPLKYVNAIDWFHTLASSVTYLSLTQWGLSAAGGYAGMPISSWAGYSAYNALIGPPNTPGISAKYNYKIVPYVVTQETDIPQIIMLLLEEISMFAHVKTAIQNTVSAVKNLIATASTNPPGDVISAIISILALIGQLLWDLTLAIALVGNIETLINQCGLLLKYKYAMSCSDIINASFDYINNYLGTPSGNPITFSSSIFGMGVAPGYGGAYVNTTVMPRKIYKENSTDVTSNLLTALKNGGVLFRGTEVSESFPSCTPGAANYGTYGYPDSNFKQFFDDIGKVFNAKLFFINGQVRFEEKHYFVAGTYQLPNVDKPSNDTLNLPAPFSYNTDELPWNYNLYFRTDDDERTMICYTGTQCSVSTQPKIAWNVQDELPCPGVDMALPFALAKRKEYLNFIEHAVNDIIYVVGSVFNLIASVINGIISAINWVLHLVGFSISIPTIPLMPTGLSGLIGCLEVSKDTWQTPKIFVGTPVGQLWYIHQFNGMNGKGTSTGWDTGVWNNPNVPINTPGRGEGYMSAWALMNQFHSLNLALFNPVNDRGVAQPQTNNQWIIYKNKKFPMCSADYASILGLNMFLIPGGVKAKFDKTKYNVNYDLGKDAQYRVSKIYSLNFTQIITVDGN